MQALFPYQVTLVDRREFSHTPRNCGSDATRSENRERTRMDPDDSAEARPPILEGLCTSFLAVEDFSDCLGVGVSERGDVLDRGGRLVPRIQRRVGARKLRLLPCVSRLCLP